ncbi:MAG TPA: serine/threonine-protein kinase, partial [Verrucomicrobiae bacterium]
MLEEKLGEGGFGEVWRARHKILDESRVFKFCFRADRVRSLKREVTLFRIIKERIGDHPNIVKLYDIYFDQPPFYLEEEYVEGRDLRSWCEARGGVDKVPLEVRLEIVAQAADALQAAHDAGVIHRDVKPGNILISGQWSVVSSQQPNDQASTLNREPVADSQPSTLNPQLSVKLTDFGIGQVTSEDVLKEVTRAGFTQTLLSPSSSHVGTQLYMAPELLAGKPASTRSDIYSLGVVLYQMVVGDFRKPLTSDWPRHVQDALLREDLENCFAGAPEERFAAAGLLAEQLRSHPKRQEAAAQQQRQQQVAARRRRFLVASGVTTAALLIIAAALGYGLRQARQERDQAQVMAYASDIYLANREFQQDSPGAAYNLLMRSRPDPKKPEQPGWEWRYLWKQVESDALYTLGEPTANSGGLAIVSGDRFARASMSVENGAKIELWDFRKQQLLAARPMETHVVDLAFSALHQVIAASTFQREVLLLDPASLETKATVDLSQEISFVEISPDGKWLAGTAGAYLVIADLGRRVQVCSTNTGAERINDVVFSPDSQFVASASSGGRAAVWRTADLSLVRYLGTPRGMGEIYGLAFSADSGSLFVGGGSLLERINVQTGRLERSFDNPLGVGLIAVSPDGSTLAFRAGGGRVKFCDSKTLAEKNCLQGNRAEVRHLLFSPQGDRLLSGSVKEVKVWDPARPSPSRGFETKNVGRNAAISPNGRFVA